MQKRVLVHIFLGFAAISISFYESLKYCEQFLPRDDWYAIAKETSSEVAAADLSRGKRLLEQHRLHDESLQQRMDPTVSRPWIELDPLDRNKARPPAMLLLSNVGWNHPNKTVGQSFSRMKRHARLVNGILNHPWFHPTAWEDIEHGKLGIDPKVRYYVFPDWATCYDVHWPKYMGFKANLDLLYNRSQKLEFAVWKRNQFDYETFDLFKAHPLFQTNGSNHSLVVELNCHEFGPAEWRLKKRNELNIPLAFASMSTNVRDMKDPIDQGLPPPCVVQVNLTKQQVLDISTCAAESENKRPFLLTFIGNYRSHGPQAFGPRGGLQRFHDNNKTFILRHFREEFKKSAIGNLTYSEILSKSLFSAAPRGDDKYSYRFSEVLSAGAIPVVFADDWLWPFRPELVDWSQCAIILPENSPHETMNVIKNITVEQRCRMRQKCYEIYKTYMEDDHGTVFGLIKGLELVAQGYRARPAGVHCKPGDDYQTQCNFDWYNP